MDNKGTVFWRCQEIGKFSDFIDHRTPIIDINHKSQKHSIKPNQPPITIADLQQIMTILLSNKQNQTKEVQEKKNTSAPKITTPIYIQNNISPTLPDYPYLPYRLPDQDSLSSHNQLEQYYWGSEFFNAYGIGTAWQIQIRETAPTDTNNLTLNNFTTEDCSPTITNANHNWQKLCSKCVCVNKKNEPRILPHQIQLPIAFGSFAFDVDCGGWLKIPAIAVVAIENRIFLYRASQNRKILEKDTVGLTEPSALDTVTKKSPHTNIGIATTPISNSVSASGKTNSITGNYNHQLATGSLSATEWQAAVQQAIEKIQHSDIEKIVLARDNILTTGKNADPVTVLSKLETQYQTCWRYWLGDLIGASPEMLTQIINNRLLCRVLAGTCSKGKEKSLLNSAKEQQEHAYAVESAYRSLKPLITNLEKPIKPFLLRLPNLSHLATDLTVTNPKISSLEAIAVLHPTAAVCGTPRKKVQQLIPELEKIDRGHYAGPIGWVDSQGQGEWAIALRCAQILPPDKADGYRYRLLAGAGIVADSVPAQEYQETNTKMQPLRRAIEDAENL